MSIGEYAKLTRPSNVSLDETVGMRSYPLAMGAPARDTMCLMPRWPTRKSGALLVHYSLQIRFSRANESNLNH